jgi:hypothetical protein
VAFLVLRPLQGNIVCRHFTRCSNAPGDPGSGRAASKRTKAKDNRARIARFVNEHLGQNASCSSSSILDSLAATLVSRCTVTRGFGRKPRRSAGADYEAQPAPGTEQLEWRSGPTGRATVDSGNRTTRPMPSARCASVGDLKR